MISCSTASVQGFEEWILRGCGQPHPPLDSGTGERAKPRAGWCHRIIKAGKRMAATQRGLPITPSHAKKKGPYGPQSGGSRSGFSESVGDRIHPWTVALLRLQSHGQGGATG